MEGQKPCPCFAGIPSSSAAICFPQAKTRETHPTAHPSLRFEQNNSSVRYAPGMVLRRAMFDIHSATVGISSHETSMFLVTS